MIYKNDRKRILLELLEIAKPMTETSYSIADLPWDSDESLVILTRAHITHAIKLFLAGELKSEDIVEWANLLEIREDVGPEVGYEELIRNIIFRLANPEINLPIDVELASSIILELHSD